MTTDGENLQVLRGSQISNYIAHLEIKAVLAAFLIILVFAVQIYRNGFPPRHLFIILSSILSMVALMSYGL